MKGFYFDFIAVPRPLVWLRTLMLLVGVTAVAATLLHYQTQLLPALRMQRDLLQAEVQKQGNTKPVSGLKADELAKTWQRAVGVKLQLSLPWQSFFKAIGEAGAGGDVAMISIEPDPVKSTVILIAEARNLDAMLGFVSKLQSSAEFSQATLLSHAIDNTTAEKPVRFRVSASWKVAE